MRGLNAALAVFLAAVGTQQSAAFTPAAPVCGRQSLTSHVGPRQFRFAPSTSSIDVRGAASHTASLSRLASSAAAAPGDDAKDASPPSPSPLFVKKSGIATFKTSKRLIAGMAFLTGWADFALVTKYKTFATMMTGNTMWMASAVVDGRVSDVFYYASAIASYVAGLVVFRKSDLAYKEKSLSRVCAPLVAALFVGADYLSYINPANRLIPISMLSLAFAVINSIGNEVGGTMTFVLTGHLTKLTALGVDRVSRAAGRKKPSDGEKSAAARCSLVIGAFFTGALWACALNSRAPATLQRGAFSAMGLLYGALFLWQDRENLGAWWLRDDEHLCEIDDLETTCT